MRYWLGPAVAIEVDPGFWGWGWPADCAGMLLVEPTAQAASGVTGGVALVWSETATLEGPWEPLGDGDIRDLQLPIRARNAWRTAVGVTVPAGTLLDALWRTLTDDADPSGGTRSRPLIPTSRGVIRLALHQHGELRRQAFRDASAQHRERVIAVVREGLNRARDEAREGRWIGPNGQPDPTGHLKNFGYQLRKLGLDENTLRPPEWPATERPRPPETSIQDTFNRADGTPLGTLSDSSGSWTELQSGWSIDTNSARCAPGASTSSVAYANVALSGDDHYADATLAALGGGSQGVICRKADSTTLTFYHARISSGNFQLFRFSSGSAVQIGSNVSGSLSASDVLRVEADGSAIRLYKNGGTALIDQSNGDITGNTRTGFRSFGDSVRWDQFDAADLAAGGTPIAAYYRHSTVTIVGGAV